MNRKWKWQIRANGSAIGGGVAGGTVRKRTTWSAAVGNPRGHGGRADWVRGARAKIWRRRRGLISGKRKRRVRRKEEKEEEGDRASRQHLLRNIQIDDASSYSVIGRRGFSLPTSCDAGPCHRKSYRTFGDRSQFPDDETHGRRLRHPVTLSAHWSSGFHSPGRRLVEGPTAVRQLHCPPAHPFQP